MRENHIWLLFSHLLSSHILFLLLTPMVSSHILLFHTFSSSSHLISSLLVSCLIYCISLLHTQSLLILSSLFLSNLIQCLMLFHFVSSHHILSHFICFYLHLLNTQSTHKQTASFHKNSIDFKSLFIQQGNLAGFDPRAESWLEAFVSKCCLWNTLRKGTKPNRKWQC